MRIFLFLLAFACTGLWIAGYAYLSLLGCAYVTGAQASSCWVDMPWDLRSEDLVYLVLIPGAIVAGLWFLFFRALRRGRTK